MKIVPITIIASFIMSLSSGVAFAGTDTSAQDIIAKSQQASYYQASDMKAKVSMALIDKNGKERSRVMTMLRIDEAGGENQKYFIYFHEPGDVRGMTFMVWKYGDKEDDRWLFIPAVDLVRRIAADDKRSSFVGSDFNYEDVSGRDVESDTYTLVREEKLNERDCYVIESVPKKVIDYTKRVSWVDKENYLPLKEEYYDRQGELYRVFTAEQVDVIASRKDEASKFPSVTKRTMANLKTGHKTEVSFEDIAYDIDLNDKDFSERYLRKPPKKWIR
ncbi:MAG: outer membrane lipoprotein-sorting protein [Candidatus Latescibacteria bacterium]|nr:outer membrane lipoprotein-sorting protein [Candidatus Latescibacterota bacterium]NIM21285.1 outer membrane lipoprotein-sorting protein [Candidatus Latescibacterota bacterium]NIM64543.1 outer membrane lipoprotein-sorting protein [Candidatus Latescibacterota bacterium]NIO00700.1 outer membrane lipoprotein-sorting protein [Candidatus Latescibacterota bacterium]NIO27099.1 outer membrane lipoprotein-sorting protein [Candidatus Latescibacterota bacterium]